MRVVAFICDCDTVQVPCFKQPPNHPVHCQSCGMKLLGVRLDDKVEVKIKRLQPWSTS